MRYYTVTRSHDLMNKFHFPHKSTECKDAFLLLFSWSNSYMCKMLHHQFEFRIHDPHTEELHIRIVY